MRPKLILPTALHQRFSDVEQVCPEQALLDKCDVVIGGWSFEAKRHQVSKLVPRISELKVPSGDGSTTRLFENRTADDDRYSHTLTVRGTGAGEGVKYPHPTFAGALKIREFNCTDGNQYAKRNWEGLFYAYLNLNRSLQAQALRRRGFGIRETWMLSHPYALAISESAKAKVRESLLAPCDNILDRSRRRTQYVQSQSAEQHFYDYVQAIFRRIQSVLPTRRSVVAQPQLPTITFQTLEVCWDFFDKQPILTVLSNKSFVQSIAQNMETRYLPIHRLEEGLSYNSPSVMVHFVDGIAIRFYAKTENTIRFEVVYSQAAINKTAGVSGIHTLAEAIRIIGTVKQDAAAKLNNLLACVRDVNRATEDHATVDELIEAVMGAAEDPSSAVSLLTLLAHHRRIAPYPRDPNYAQLKSLKRAKVLMNEARSPRSRNYVVTPRFRKARSQLIGSSVIASSKPIRPKKRRRMT